MSLRVCYFVEVIIINVIIKFSTANTKLNIVTKTKALYLLSLGKHLIASTILFKFQNTKPP